MARPASSGFFDVAAGRMEMPYLTPTRIEEDFVEAVKALAETDPQATWTFICDGLNTHKSEALVRFVAEACAHRICFVHTPKHSSWMNRIEIWFCIINRKLLKRKSYQSNRRTGSKYPAIY